MKIFSLPIKILALTLIINFGTNSQTYKSIGGYLGGGFISSNSPDLGAFSSSIFFETGPVFTEGLSMRLSFIYTGDFEMIIPDSRNVYSPFMKGFSLKGILYQPLSGIYFLEEGLGILVLNDRTFSDRNDWSFGAVFSLLAGIDLRDSDTIGFKLGAGTEYGLTFTNNSPKFFSLFLQGNYFF